VGIPADAGSLAGTLKPVHLRYAQELNRRLGQSGFVWQGRFFSCPLDQRHAWAAVRYVERNPVRAGLVRRAQDYPWSSAAGHCGLREDPMLSGSLEFSDEIADWTAWLAEQHDDEVLARLRLHTRTGRLAADDSFVDKVESLVGRILRPQRAGRPSREAQCG